MLQMCGDPITEIPFPRSTMQGLLNVRGRGYDVEVEIFNVNQSQDQYLTYLSGLTWCVLTVVIPKILGYFVPKVPA